MRFTERKSLDLAGAARRVGDFWRENGAFQASVALREGAPRFVFYEGPPSANGLPGIHHVMARTLKDCICRYKTQRGFQVSRKAGWDTHGLPVELGVETMLGITKEDIGKKISIEKYNQTCRQEVMKYTDKWRELTDMMGFWIDMDSPYITYDNKYIETLWHLLQQIYNRGFLTKGKTIQPYSPAAGTGLSTHELNQPGCYRDVTDTTVVAQFRAVDADGTELSYEGQPLYFLAWTTTPWTLPSNTALAVGAGIEYDYIETFNPYSGAQMVVVLAAARVNAYFKAEEECDGLLFDAASKGSMPWRRLKRVNGSELIGTCYQPVFPWVRPSGRAFEVLAGDFVSTEDGTGIVHIAPTFGADDARVAKQAGISPMVLVSREGEEVPMVDRVGRFYPLQSLDEQFMREFVNTAQYREWAGRFVKADYTTPDNPMGGDLDVDLCVDLKQRGLAFRIEKHKHSYPHCWRTDKPVLYYPLDSWFIRTTEVKERMLELNETINWKPESTGTGRFGKWLENLVDWNLSRSRYWGTPLPIWVSEDGQEEICIGSLEQLQAECEKAVAAGVMLSNPLASFVPGDFSRENYNHFDLHRPFVDTITLVSPSGKPMYREPDLIDVWFDSGAMPYAQWHYPFENKEIFSTNFPGDFIAEGVDQTRGWFFTLHAIATMISDSVAFRNIISNGLVLDKNGNKMSKRLGNAVDPFVTMKKLGPDAVRWYMMTNSQPWENLKFDISGVEEVVRKFFGTLHNTYAFFSLYANVDNFTGQEAEVPLASRPELDRWILSRLNSLVKEVTESLDDYEPTRAGRSIQDFAIEHLSNWYVRLNRKRFWGGQMTEDKLAAYQTLYTCLRTITQLMASIAPFYADQLWHDLHPAQHGQKEFSVHLTDFPQVDAQAIDRLLEERMAFAQRITSLVLALRRKVSIKVRQPLSRVMIPVLSPEFEAQLRLVESVILSEVNVKEMEYLDQFNTVIVKRIKPDFKALGPRFGKQMKEVAAYLGEASQEVIAEFERTGSLTLPFGGSEATIALSEVEVLPEDIPGWLVATDGELTVALDITITEELRNEGAAREVVNRVQNLRKESGLDVTDRIELFVSGGKEACVAIESNAEYISGQTLAVSLRCVEMLPSELPMIEVELDDELGNLQVSIGKVENR